MIMKQKILISGGAVALALIAILLLKPFSKKEAEYTFDTVKVQKGNISNVVTATGTVEAMTTVEVGTQVSGIIEHVYVDFNDNVKQGQVLARLDETSLRAQLQQSQASLDQAQAQLNFQEATWNRLKALYDKELIAKADYDQALYNYENAKAAVSNARSSVDRAKVNLAYATITSPIDGVVLNRAIEEGQTVAASFNTPEMFTIVNDLTQMEIQASVDEADIGQVKQGQRVDFTVDTYPDEKFAGSVSQVRLQPVTTNTVVTYVVIFSAPNPDKKLMPGMTANAIIYIQEKPNTLILSGKAMRFTPDAEYMMKMAGKSGPGAVPAGMPAVMPTEMPAEMPAAAKMVWMKDVKGGIRPVPVTVGIINSSSVEILSGLNEGDEVIISMNNPAKKATARANAGPGGPPMF